MDPLIKSQLLYQLSYWCLGSTILDDTAFWSSHGVNRGLAIFMELAGGLLCRHFAGQAAVQFRAGRCSVMPTASRLGLLM